MTDAAELAGKEVYSVEVHSHHLLTQNRWGVSPVFVG